MFVNKGKVVVNFIVGIYWCIGDLEEDICNVLELCDDFKENVEYIMLVDLACNDLGCYVMNVKVEFFKDI